MGNMAAERRGHVMLSLSQLFMTSCERGKPISAQVGHHDEKKRSAQHNEQLSISFLHLSRIFKNKRKVLSHISQPHGVEFPSVCNDI